MLNYFHYFHFGCHKMGTWIGFYASQKASKTYTDAWTIIKGWRWWGGAR